MEIRERVMPGVANFETASLRSRTTGLPFTIYIVQSYVPDGAHVQVASESGLGLYTLKPFRYAAGWRLGGNDEAALARWVEANLETLLDYWTGRIASTEDAIERLVK